MQDNWVLDATVAHDGPPWPFCPLEGDPRGDFSIVVGMTYVSDTPPGNMVGIVHEDGNEAVEKWCAEHPDALELLKKP